MLGGGGRVTCGRLRHSYPRIFLHLFASFGRQLPNFFRFPDWDAADASISASLFNAMPCRRTLANAVGTHQTNPKVKFHGLDLRALPPVAGRAKWPVFTPPAAGQSGRYRGLLSHRRSQNGLSATQSELMRCDQARRAFVALRPLSTPKMRFCRLSAPMPEITPRRIDAAGPRLPRASSPISSGTMR